MSIAVELSALAERLAEFGPVAYLVTVGESGHPHVVSVRPRLEGGTVLVGAGSRTGANAEQRPQVSLLWPGAPGAGYSLIVDGRARRSRHGEEELLAISPTKAVLHRTPEGDPSAPSCITVLSEA